MKYHGALAAMQERAERTRRYMARESTQARALILSRRNSLSLYASAGAFLIVLFYYLSQMPA